MTVRVDRDEILAVGELHSDADVVGFREVTRDARVALAAEAEERFARKVCWGVRQGDREIRFSPLSVPVMTRLRIDERGVLDALIDGGIGRSRSEALAWCVRLVGRHQKDWLEELLAASRHVEEVRRRGPQID